MIACCGVVASAADLKCIVMNWSLYWQKLGTIAADTIGGDQYVNVYIVYIEKECKMWGNVQ